MLGLTEQASELQKVLQWSRPGQSMALYFASILDTIEKQVCIEDSSQGVSLNTWHCRLGHALDGGTRKMSANSVVEGLKVSSASTCKQCSSCVSAKISRNVIQKLSAQRTREVLELVCSDVCGPIEIKSKGGVFYFAKSKEEFSKWTRVYPISAKSEVFNVFKTVLTFAEHQKAKQISSMHSDGGNEYIDSKFRFFWKLLLNRFDITSSHKPQKKIMQSKWVELSWTWCVQCSKTTLFPEHFEQMLCSPPPVSEIEAQQEVFLKAETASRSGMI